MLMIHVILWQLIYHLCLSALASVHSYYYTSLQNILEEQLKKKLIQDGCLLNWAFIIYNIISTNIVPILTPSIITIQIFLNYPRMRKKGSMSMKHSLMMMDNLTLWNLIEGNLVMKKMTTCHCPQQLETKTKRSIFINGKNVVCNKQIQILSRHSVHLLQNKKLLWIILQCFFLKVYYR